MSGDKSIRRTAPSFVPQDLGSSSKVARNNPLRGESAVNARNNNYSPDGLGSQFANPRILHQAPNTGSTLANLALRFGGNDRSSPVRDTRTGRDIGRAMAALDRRNAETLEGID